jgi:cellulose synthase/poly-beta-1,6-N-acetylglucosamine synthase-like glycosyltransferase
MTFFLIGSDIYRLKKHLQKEGKSDYQPSVSVVIPAFNEEKSIIASVTSVLGSAYPKNKMEVIVINDGSKDGTERVLKKFLSENVNAKIKLVTQSNSGKAHSLNNGIKNYAKGELIICLDADSILTKDTIKNAVRYFEEKSVMAMASNVKIRKEKGILNLIQVFEYAISYQMKRALTLFNIEYIIGGVGSVFRKSILEDIDFYDTNTVTEDIDLTMKILSKGNKKYRVVYGADVIAYTQSALTLGDLIKQRYRWKWGRYQTFLKNRHMFFSRDSKYTKGLSWFYLPFAVYSDLAFFFEPLLVTYIWFVVLYFKDLQSFFTMVAIITFYMGINVLSEETFSFKEKFELVMLAPLIYFLFYILSLVEYVALIKSWVNIRNLPKSLTKNKNSWQPINRSGF